MKLIVRCFSISIITVMFAQSEYFGFSGQETSQYNTPLQNVNTQQEHNITRRDKINLSTDKPVYQKGMSFAETEIVSLNEKIHEFELILLTSDDVGERIDAITQLGYIGGKQAIPVIAIALNDDNYSVRSQVIETLSGMDINNTAHLLGEVLFNEKEQELKLQALKVLAENDSIAGLSLLQYFSINAEDDVIRNQALEMTMHRVPINETIKKEDFYGIMRQISSLPTEEEISKLQHILKQAPDAGLREEAVLALANSNDKTVIPIIESALADTSSDVRYQAIHVLTNAQKNPLSMLGQVLFSDPDPELRIEVLNLIALENTPASISFLEYAQNDTDENVREIVGYYLNMK